MTKRFDFGKNEIGFPPPMMLRLAIACFPIMTVKIWSLRIAASNRYRPKPKLRHVSED